MRASCLALLVVSWLAAEAHAQPAERVLSEVLTIEGSDACLVPTALVQAVAMWLGRATVPAQLGVSVVVSDSASVRFVVHSDGKAAAERSFPVLPAACADRRAALGLAIALAIDHAVLHGLGIAPPAPAPSSPSPAPPRAAELPPPARALSLEVDAGAVLLASVLPELAPTGRLAVEVGLGPASLRAAGLATLEQTFLVGSGQTRAALVAASLEGCFARSWPVVAAGACLGSTLGQLRAEGSSDFAAPQRARLPWAAVSGGLFARLFSRRGYGLRADVLGLVPYVRPHLEELDMNGDVLHELTFPVAGILAGMSFSLVLH